MRGGGGRGLRVVPERLRRLSPKGLADRDHRGRGLPYIARDSWSNTGQWSSLVILMKKGLRTYDDSVAPDHHVHNLN